MHLITDRADSFKSRMYNSANDKTVHTIYKFSYFYFFYILFPTTNGSKHALLAEAIIMFGSGDTHVICFDVQIFRENH